MEKNFCTKKIGGVNKHLFEELIWRCTKKKGAPPRWFENSIHPCLCFFTKGASQSVYSMYEWVQDILIPHLDAEGRGENEWACLILDPAASHIHADTKQLLKDSRIALAMMPASTT